MFKDIMIIAGEASGDQHGASLIRELKRIDPQLNFFGIGGKNMISAGFNADYHIKDMAFLGFWEILKHIPFIREVKKNLINKIKETKTTAVILIDYPGFNLNIAKTLKKLGVKIIYYISPQVWAWRKKRIKKIKRLVNKMFVIFPFEKEIYEQAGLEVEYVGHPLVEMISNFSFLSKEELFKNYGLDSEKEILLLMPGSREQEIKRIFPNCIKAAQILAAESNMQVITACPENIDDRLFDEFISDYSFKVIKNDSYNLLKHSQLGIIKSGTSTLEAGYFTMPFIVVYSTNMITYWIGKLLVKIDNIAMANIIAGENIVDELIQNDMTVDNIYLKCRAILSDKNKYESIRNKLSIIKTKLGNIGASQKAAKAIYKLLNET